MRWPFDCFVLSQVQVERSICQLRRPLCLGRSESHQLQRARIADGANADLHVYNLAVDSCARE